MTIGSLSHTRLTLVLAEWRLAVSDEAQRRRIESLAPQQQLNEWCKEHAKATCFLDFAILPALATLLGMRLCIHSLASSPSSVQSFHIEPDSSFHVPQKLVAAAAAAHLPSINLVFIRDHYLALISLDDVPGARSPTWYENVCISRADLASEQQRAKEQQRALLELEETRKRDEEEALVAELERHKKDAHKMKRGQARFVGRASCVRTDGDYAPAAVSHICWSRRPAGRRRQGRVVRVPSPTR